MYLSNRVNRTLRHPAVMIVAVFALLISGSVLFLSRDSFRRPHTLREILKNGELVFMTRNNAHCYYLYRGQAMGFEYDLAKAFADFLGVKLKLKVAEKWGEMLGALLTGTGHIAAPGVAPTPARRRQAAFSDGYMELQQHIIVHRDNKTVRSVSDLNGKTVYVRKGSPYQDRLEALKAEGLDIDIQADPNRSTEELIAQVAAQEIDITVAGTNVAKANRRYYPQIRMVGAISPKQQLAWAVHPRAFDLLERIDLFFKTIRTNGVLKEIYDQYYTSVDTFDYVDLRAYHRRLNSRLPKYLSYIEAAADSNGFDWRLIAAQIYQESHFRRWAKSHAGAYGLMQLTRRTAKKYGVKKIFDPEQNIHAGVKHMKRLYDLLDDAQGMDRLFITFAAYNIGLGHIRDAQRLAVEMGLDPLKWASLSKTLPLLQKRKYYENAQYGYCRGIEPLVYVRQIMIYYDILRHQGIEYNHDPSVRTTPLPQI